MKNKICTKCKIAYPATPEYFVRDGTHKDGLFSICKKCKNEGHIKYYNENKDKIKKDRKEWRDNNKELKREMDRKYNEKMKNRKKEDIIIPENKFCKGCNENKKYIDFYEDVTSKSGLTTFCKDCSKEKNRKSYQKHKEKRKADTAIYIKNNKEKISQKHKDYYLKNKEQIKKYKAQWQRDNKDRLRESAKKWRSDNKDRLLEQSRYRRKNDLNYRMLNNLRGRLYYALKRQNAVKSCGTVSLMGCTVDELKKHLQVQFLEGMTFDNYGLGNEKWCIDHIKPCALFNLLDPEQQRLCFHYTNLRPLWNIDNSSKNSFYDGKYIRNKKIKKEI